MKKILLSVALVAGLSSMASANTSIYEDYKVLADGIIMNSSTISIVDKKLNDKVSLEEFAKSQALTTELSKELKQQKNENIALKERLSKLETQLHDLKLNKTDEPKSLLDSKTREQLKAISHKK